jgi:hypothetical protein
MAREHNGLPTTPGVITAEWHDAGTGEPPPRTPPAKHRAKING